MNYGNFESLFASNLFLLTDGIFAPGTLICQMDYLSRVSRPMTQCLKIQKKSHSATFVSEASYVRLFSELKKLNIFFRQISTRTENGQFC